MRRGLREIKIPASRGLRDIKTGMKVQLLSIPRLRRRADAQEYELPRVDDIHQNLAQRAEYFGEHLDRRKAYEKYQQDSINQKNAQYYDSLKKHIARRKAHEEFREEQLAQRKEQYVRHQQGLEKRLADTTESVNLMLNEFCLEREASERVWQEMSEILREKRRKCNCPSDIAHCSV